MISMSFKEKEAYNNIPIPNIDEIVKSEQYNSMIKFDIKESQKVGRDRLLIFPEIIIYQYSGKKVSELLGTKNEINGLMLWHSRRGLITRMILVPEATHNSLLEMYDKTKILVDYFEEKDPLTLTNHKDIAYRLQDTDGKFSKFRHAGTNMRYYANNGIYVLMEKILPPEKGLPSKIIPPR